MKKKLITALITSIVMIAAMGGFLWKMNSVSKEIAKKNEAAEDEERDMAEYQSGKAIDETSELDIIPLYLSGDKKNVVTVGYDSVADVYNTDKSARAEKTLTDLKERAEIYEADTALWAYNPYGTNNNSMYVYFKTSGRCYCKYTISVKDSKIPDFTRTLINNSSGNTAVEHEYQLVGLVQGQTNYITMKLYNKDDELFRTVVYSVDIPKSDIGSENFLSVNDGRSKSKLSNGLYTIFEDGKNHKETSTRIVTKKVRKNGRTVTRRVKKNVTKNVKKYAILMYDNSGVLRCEIPLDGYCGRNIDMAYDGMLYAPAEDKIAIVNTFGQVTRVYKINGYKQSGEFAYDEYGSIYVICTPRSKNAVKNSVIIKLKLSDGATEVALDMKTLLPEVYKNAAKRTGRSNPNWIDVNSIAVTGTNQLLVSSQAFSSIFKVSNVSSIMPKVDYIISDKSIWDDYKSLRRKVLTKALEGEATPEPTEEPLVNSILDTKPKKAPELFDSQAGQNSIVYETSSGLAEGQYYLTMLNNNSGVKATKSGYSYYYKFLVDETARTYILSEDKRFEKTSDEGNITKIDDVYIYCRSGNKTFKETDATGKLIREFKANRDLYRVYKSDWKGFWFY